MDNHFHLLIETAIANLSRCMHYLKGTYAISFNRVHRVAGHLFQGRYDAVIVEKESHLLEVSRYIPLNPVRAGMCADPADYKWSSYRATIGLEPALSFLKVGPVLDQFSTSTAHAQKLFQAFSNEENMRCPWDQIKNRLYLGSDEFVERMHKKIGDEEIPVMQRLATRPKLKELLKNDLGIQQAYREYGYTMKQIGSELGVHYKTVSRRIGAIEKLA